MSDEGTFARRTVAVTGAGGFIGGTVCRRLVSAGAEVRGIDLGAGAAERVRGAGAAFIDADVTDREAIGAALEGADGLVHTAAFVHEHGRMDDFVRVNVGGTACVLDAARDAGVGRAVHISSVVVYGYDDPAEQSEGAYRRAYGIPYIDTKSASDRIACDRGAVVVRPGDVYGPASTQWVLRPLRLALGGRLAVPGEGDGIMLPVYVDDLAAGILAALDRGAEGAAYTVWSGEHVTFADYFDRIARLGGMREARRLPRPLAVAVAAAMEAIAVLRKEPPEFSRRAITFVDRRGTVSNRRAREELGWEPAVDLDEGMRRTEEWLRAEGQI